MKFMDRFGHVLVVVGIALGFVMLFFIAYKVFIINIAISDIGETISSWDTTITQK